MQFILVGSPVGVKLFQAVLTPWQESIQNVKQAVCVLRTKAEVKLHDKAWQAMTKIFWVQ